MQKVNRPQDKWRNIALAVVTLLIILADQLSKTWIRDNLFSGQKLYDAGFFQIINISNTGAAFGIFPGQALALTIISFIGAAVLLVFAFIIYRRWPAFNSMWIKLAVALLLGGTIGNLIDRLRLGYVTDFINFKIWPAFNVADSAVTIGVILIAYFVLRLALAEKHQDEENL